MVMILAHLSYVFLSDIGCVCSVVNTLPFVLARGRGIKQFKTLKIWCDFWYMVLFSALATVYFVENGSTVFGSVITSCERVVYKTELSSAAVVILTNRMFCDLFVTVVNGGNDVMTNLVHHMIVIVGNGLCIYYDMAHMFLMVGVMTEYSTLFLNFRILYTNGLGISSDVLDRVVLALFACSFFMVRVVNLPISMIVGLYDYFHCEALTTKHLVFIVPPGLIMLLSYYWFFWKIIPLCKKNLFETPTKRDKATL